MEKPIVKVEHLSHRYSVQWAVRDISFEIRRKGILGLLGSNGAGKSTTMNIICGVLNQTEGDVWINGINLKEDPVEAKRFLGFLPQKAPLYTDLTVDEYLRHCAQMRQMDKKEIREAVDKAKERCGITHFSKRLIRNLSGGYQQRVGIAQAIVHNPRFVVLDEPTNGLDPNQITGVRHLIREIATDRSVMLSTHILPEVQATCEEIMMIEHGHVVFSGSMQEFNKVNKPNTVLINLLAPPSSEELEKIPGVIRTENINANRFRIHFEAGTDICRDIVDISGRKGWRLNEITLERESLDAAFAQLSKKSVQCAASGVQVES